MTLAVGSVLAVVVLCALILILDTWTSYHWARYRAGRR